MKHILTFEFIYPKYIIEKIYQFFMSFWLIFHFKILMAFQTLILNGIKQYHTIKSSNLHVQTNILILTVTSTLPVDWDGYDYPPLSLGVLEQQNVFGGMKKTEESFYVTIWI